MLIIETTYRLSGEPQLEQLIRTVISLLDIPTDDPQNPDHKPFRKLKGNSLSGEDIQKAEAIARRRIKEMHEFADTAPCPFPEQEEGSNRVETTWRDGIRSTTRLAERELDSFLEKFNELLENPEG